MIELEMDLCRPQLDLELWAEKESLPLVRQALRALGESAGIETETIHDAELAVTEACANVVLHAYRDRGRIEVSLEARSDDLLAIVRDRGRGIAGEPNGSEGRKEGGLGLTVIDGIADRMEIRSVRGRGTEVTMALPFAVNDGPITPELAHTRSLEHIVRRLVAMVAAQADMTPGRITEALLVAELVVSSAREELLDDCLAVTLSRLADGLELRIGPLEPGGAEAALRKAEVPALGSVVERLVDRLWTEPSSSVQPEAGERLAARFGGAPSA